MKLNRVLSGGLKFLTQKNYRTLYLAAKGKYDCLPDKDYLEMIFPVYFGDSLNLENPQTFNEKLQWLKLYNRQPGYTLMVDKYRVRKYIQEQIGEKYLIPLLGVWDKPELIDFGILPNQFVLKCNHNSGMGMYICKNKSEININKVKKSLERGLQEKYYLRGREWPYKNVQPRIIAEKYMSDESGELIDYKVHNFNGEPKFILVCKDRFKDSGLTEDFYTVDWERMPVKRPGTPNSSTPMKKPEQLEEILKLSRKLAKDIPFVRTDFYIINGKVFFSELTFYPASGFSKFEPEKWDRTFGDWIKLPSDRINTGR